MPCATRTAAARASPATRRPGRSTRRSSPTRRARLWPRRVSSGGGATLDAAADLAPVVERFFDEVLVMSDDEAVRRNRLTLVANVRDRLRRLGDFAQLPG